MYWLGGVILLSVYSTGSGRSIRDEPEAERDCHRFQSVSRMVRKCIPSEHKHVISFGEKERDKAEVDPSKLLILNGQYCLDRHSIDTCLTEELAHCENRLEIQGFVDGTRALCNGTELVHWFSDAVTSLPSIRFKCLWEQLSNAMQGVCSEAMRAGEFDYSLEEGMIKVEPFLTTALGCLLRNMEELYGQSPTCSGVDIKRAMFAAVSLINGLSARNAIFLFRASHLQQIKDTLLPFENQDWGFQDVTI